MDKAKIERINFLAKKAKESGLTEEEISERDKLRREYLDAVKANFKSMLDNVEIQK